MKLVVFTRRGSATPMAGVLTDRGVAPLDGMAGPSALIQAIDRQPDLRPGPTDLIPLDQVTLLPPLPRPGKLLCSTATYGSPPGERAPLLLTLKSAESVIGPDQTVELPQVGPEWKFVPEAELGVVIRGPAKTVKASDWQQAVFGYTCVIDVMAQGDTQFGRDFWLAKSDTLGPLGPCIVTADEIADAQSLRVASSINGQPAQEYSMADADYSIGEQIELATTIMTLYSGDVLACGTSRRGLRPISDGDEVQVEVAGIGQLKVRVAARSGVVG
jgi:2-keto-4-pentenoate hydratase/2-oxohepta-3-ene-1,7-dioic acid hydratase in catechol pathway